MSATTAAHRLSDIHGGVSRLRWALRDGLLPSGNPGSTSGGWLAEHAVMLGVMWPLLVTALTLPLAVRSFQRLSR